MKKTKRAVEFDNHEAIMKIAAESNHDVVFYVFGNKERTSGEGCAIEFIDNTRATSLVKEVKRTGRLKWGSHDYTLRTKLEQNNWIMYDALILAKSKGIIVKVSY